MGMNSTHLHNYWKLVQTKCGTKKLQKKANLNKVYSQFSCLKGGESLVGSTGISGIVDGEGKQKPTKLLDAEHLYNLPISSLRSGCATHL